MAAGDVSRSEPSVGALLQACEARTGTMPQRPVGWLVGDDERSAWTAADRVEARLRARDGAVCAAGGWRPGSSRPFGGLAELADALAARLHQSHPELLQRYNLTLASVAPAWRETELLRRTRVLSSGLADFTLRGDTAGLKDFYWKCDHAPKIVADLVHFVIDAAMALADGDRRPADARPVVLRLDGLEQAEPLSLGALALLGHYSGQAPLVLFASVPADALTRVAGLLGGGWQTIAPVSGPADEPTESTGPQGRTPTPDTLVEPADNGALFGAASVFARPFTTRDLHALAVEASLATDDETTSALASVDEWIARGVERGLLRPAAGDRFTVAATAWRDRSHEGMSDALRRQLHRAALVIERGDPFAASWHARMGELGEDGREIHARALAAAWAVSHHASVLDLAILLVKESGSHAGAFDPDLLLGMAHYDAGRGREADECFRAALVRGGDVPRTRAQLTHFLGYNAVFVLGDFERGRRLLEEVLALRREPGGEADEGYLRNTIAYALFRAGRVEEAVVMEREALAALARAQEPAGFLSSILQLNLGRLQRNLGMSDHALDLLSRALADQSWDVSPYMLLIFDSARAALHAARGEHAAALGACHHALELARTLKLEYASPPVSTTLAQLTGTPVASRLTRGDEILFQLFLGVALCCHRLGLEDDARTCVAGLRARWGFLSPEVWRSVEQACSAASSSRPSLAPPADVRAPVDDETGDAIDEYADLVRPRISGDSQRVAAADLVDGRSLALVCPQRRGGRGDVCLVTSLVLHHPGRIDVARRVNAEIGSAGLPRTRSMLILEEDAHRVPGLRTDLPRFYQQVTLDPELRVRFAGLEPVRAHAQVVGSDDEPFATLLREVRRLTGIGVLAAVPFHLRGRDLATTTRDALHAFAISGVDDLLLGERLLEKTCGSTATENLLPFCPRLSRHASLHEEAGDEGGLVVQIRIASYESDFLRLHRQMKPLLALCDGRHTVAAILEQVKPAWGGTPDIRRQTCDLLRHLWRRGAIRFDSLLVGRRTHASA